MENFVAYCMDFDPFNGVVFWPPQGAILIGWNRYNDSPVTASWEPAIEVGTLVGRYHAASGEPIEVDL